MMSGVQAQTHEAVLIKGEVVISPWIRCYPPVMVVVIVSSSPGTGGGQSMRTIAILPKDVV